MIIELKEVVQKIEQLTEEEQLIIAKMLDGELQWKITLQEIQGKLSNLAKELINQSRSEETMQEDW